MAKQFTRNEAMRIRTYHKLLHRSGSALLVVAAVWLGSLEWAHGQSARVITSKKMGDEGGNPADPPLVNNYVQFNAGIMLVNPYSVNTNNGITELEDGDSQGRFFFEVAANYVWAWDWHRRWEWIQARKGHDVAPTGGRRFLQGKLPATHYSGELGIGLPDFSGRLIFMAQDDKKTTAAAIVGTGELGLETTMGVPFFQAVDTYSGNLTAHTDATKLFKDTRSTHWVGAVGSWSGVTDASAFDIHSRYFVGLGYRAAFKVPWETDTEGKEFNREIAMNFQIGKAWVDAVKFKDRSTHEVVDEKLGEPRYRMKGSMAVEAEFFIPLGKSLNGLVGARFYPISGSDTPNTWNAYVGLTVPLTKLGAFFE